MASCEENNFYGVCGVSLNADGFFGEMPVTNPPDNYPCHHSCIDSENDLLGDLGDYGEYPLEATSKLTGMTIWKMTAVGRFSERLRGG